MKQMLKNQVPLLIIGATGVGKTQISSNLIHSLKPDEWLVVNMNFAARTNTKTI